MSTVGRASCTCVAVSAGVRGSGRRDGGAERSVSGHAGWSADFIKCLIKDSPTTIVECIASSVRLLGHSGLAITAAADGAQHYFLGGHWFAKCFILDYRSLRR